MFILSPASRRRYEQLDPRLQLIVDEALQEFNFGISCGFRNYADQEQAVREGKSDCHWPDSKHNRIPSMAMDCYPVPLDWKDLERFKAMNAVFERIAANHNIPIKCAPMIGKPGKKYPDYPHTELLEGKGEDNA